MTDKELRRLNRGQLLELLLAQSQEIDRLRDQVEALSAQVNDRILKQKEAGSIAEAALKMNRIFEEAQKAADLYLENVKRNAQRYGEPENEKTPESEEERRS